MLAVLDSKAFASFMEVMKPQLANMKPELALVGTITVLVLGAAFVRRESSWWLGFFALAGTLVSLALVLGRYGVVDPAKVDVFTTVAGGGASLRIDRFANFFSAVFLVGTAVTIVLTFLSRELDERPMGEFYAILLSAVLGMMLMAEAVDLLMIFVAIELLSVPSYVLTGWLKKSRLSSEAALKYVIYGSVSAGLMLYGFSLFYGMTGSLKIADIAALVSDPKANMAAVGLAAFLSFAGFGYKMAAVPMQFWAPDVYQGAPVSVTAWLSVTSKAAGVALFIRFMNHLGLGEGIVSRLDWVSLVALLSAITMTLGNLGALHQTNLKRLLAYSSVAHVGYILMGVAAFGAGQAAGIEGYKAVSFYVVAYLLMNLGAFACVLLASNHLKSEELEDWKGLARRAPRVAFAFAVFLISLIGIPPTAGFSGKLQLFMAAVNQGLIWLVVVAAVNTAISAYYYAKVLKTMYLDETEKGTIRIPLGGELLLAAHLFAVVYLGVFFDHLVRWTSDLGPLRQQ